MLQGPSHPLRITTYQRAVFTTRRRNLVSVCEKRKRMRKRQRSVQQMGGASVYGSTKVKYTFVVCDDGEDGPTP